MSHLVALLSILVIVGARCVTLEQCEEIRLNANYWKPDEYDAYNDADDIEDGLYLGNVCAAHNPGWLRKHNITIIVNLAREWKEACLIPGYDIRHFNYVLDDSASEDENRTRHLFKEAAKTIALFMKEKVTPVLVHCNMGISRSASAVLTYLQQKYPRRSHRQLLRMIQARRPVTRPNDLFGRILTENEL